MKNAQNGECFSVPADWPAQMLQKKLHTVSLTEIVNNALTWANARCGEQFTLRQVKGPSRKADLVAVRHWYCWYLRVVAQWSFPKIALNTGKRDHATIMHGVGKINIMLGLPKNWPDAERAIERQKRFESDIQDMAQRLRDGERLCDIACEYSVSAWQIKAQFAMQGIDYEKVKQAAEEKRILKQYSGLFLADVTGAPV